MSDDVRRILESLGASTPGDNIPGIGRQRIDTRFESSFDVLRRATLSNSTPNIFGKSDSVEAVVLRSEPIVLGPTGPSAEDRVAYCKVLNHNHTSLLPDPTSLDPTDAQSQALISGFPKFRYSSLAWGDIIPPGVQLNVIFDPGSLHGGVVESVVMAAGAMPPGMMPGVGAPGNLPGQFAFPNPPATFLGEQLSGPTPNADHLRAVLKELGYVEKGTEISSSGVDITLEMSKAASAVFKTVKQTIPAISIRVTGGNDAFHYGLVCVGGAWGSGGRKRSGKSGKCYSSRHTRGRAIDFTLSPATDANVASVETVLRGFAAGNNPNFRYLNEYASPTAAATAKHYHMSWGQGSEGKAELAEAIAMADAGQIKKFPVSGFYA